MIRRRRSRGDERSESRKAFALFIEGHVTCEILTLDGGHPTLWYSGVYRAKDAEITVVLKTGRRHGWGVKGSRMTSSSRKTYRIAISSIMVTQGEYLVYFNSFTRCVCVCVWNVRNVPVVPGTFICSTLEPSNVAPFPSLENLNINLFYISIKDVMGTVLLIGCVTGWA